MMSSLKNFFLIVFGLLFFTNCESNTSTSPFKFDDNYTVVVTKQTTGTVRTFPDEDISLISNYEYQTATTGLYSLTELSAATNAGLHFSFNPNTGIITIPEQNLAGVYSNLVRGMPLNNGNDGAIINENSFQVVYEIIGTSNVSPQPWYKAIYTRN